MAQPRDGGLRRGFSRGGGALGTAVLLAALMMACASSTDGVPQSKAPVVPGPTITGNYLAAEYARAAGADGDAATFLLAALERAPRDPVLLGRAYYVLLLDGRTVHAVQIARRFLEVESDAPLAAIVVAMGDLHAGRFDAAAARLERVPPGPLASFLVPLLRAWTEFGRGDLPAAMAALQTLQANPSTAPLHDVHAAWLMEAAGDRAAALQHVQAAVAAQPEPWLRLAELAGGIYERAGRPAEAEALYRRYLEKHPDSELLAPALARVQAGTPPSRGKAPERDIVSARDGAAEALFDAAGIVGRQNNRETALALGQLGLYLRPDFPPLQVLVADMLDGEKRWEAANAIYAAVDPAHPLAPSARVGMARNLDRLERFDEARAMLLQMAAERPKDPDPLSELGDLLRKRERFAEAAEAYDQAIARMGTLQPRHWRLLYARGIALERSKQWPRAEADFLQALEFEPDQPLVLNYLGYSWVEQGRNLGRAEAMIRKAVELRPEDGYIVDSLGWVLFRLGRAAEAVPHLERAVELRPEDPVINDHLGDAYWAVGREREARYQWRAALVAGPEPELKTAIERKLAEGPVRSANAEAR